MYTVLYLEKFGKHYTGFTFDFEGRMMSHNVLGKKDWSKRYCPWRVILVEKYETKREAMKAR
jgi:predicted GIY-YIG superfamily endonuclease